MKPSGPTQPKTEEHKAKIAESVSISMEGNQNALGTTVNQQDNLAPELVEEVSQLLGKLKWCNNGERSKMIAVNDAGEPIKEEYTGWVLGQLHKKPKK